MSAKRSRRRLALPEWGTPGRPQRRAAPAPEPGSPEAVAQAKAAALTKELAAARAEAKKAKAQNAKVTGRPRRRRLFLVALVLVAGIGIGVRVSPSSHPTDPFTSSESAKKVPAKPITTSPRSDLPPGAYLVDQVVTFDNGSTLTVSKAVPYTLTSSDTVDGTFTTHVRVTVTFTNGAKTTFTPETLLSASSGGFEADRVYGLSLDRPRTAVLPGRKITWDAAFAVRNPDDLTVTVGLSYEDYEDVTFVDQR
jgi:hypothetical protein